jgi:hypothetical protein
MSDEGDHGQDKKDVNKEDRDMEEHKGSHPCKQKQYGNGEIHSRPHFQALSRRYTEQSDGGRREMFA